MQLSVDEDAFRNLFVQKYVPDNKLNGIPINTNIIVLPDLENLNTIMRCVDGRSFLRAMTKYVDNGYIVAKNGKIAVSDDAETRIKEEYSQFVESAEEEVRYKAAKKLADALNNVCKLLPENPFFKAKIQFEGELESVLTFDEQGNFVPDECFIKTGKVSGVYSFGSAMLNTPKREKIDFENTDPEHDRYITNLMNLAGETD